MASTAELSTSPAWCGPTTLSTLLDQDWAPLYLANAILCSGSEQGIAAAQGLREAIQQCLAFAAVCHASRVVRLLPPRHLNDAVFRSDPSRYAAFEWQSLSVRGRSGLAAVVQCEWKDQGWEPEGHALSGRATRLRAERLRSLGKRCHSRLRAAHTTTKLDLFFRPLTTLWRY